MTAKPISTGSNIVALLVALGLCFGAGAIGGMVTGPVVADATGWYATLVKPVWNPPGWVFGPAWTVLFALMAISAWLVWRRVPAGKRTLPAAVFLLQLALNVGWSWFFFGKQRPDLALIDIGALWLAIFATIYVFHRWSTLAAWLLVPYILWVTFATTLNTAICRLNGY